MRKGTDKKKLNRGNAYITSVATGYSLVYVKQVLVGDRKNEIIVETAGIVAEEKAQMLKRVKERVKSLTK